jgi:2-aminoethylphosphonate dioxygenase
MTATQTTTQAGALSSDQLADYDKRGYLVLHQLFSAAEVAELQAESVRLIQRKDLMSERNLRCRFQPHVETEEPLFEVFDPVNDISPLCERVSTERRILDVLRPIYDDEPCLFKDKLIYKLPGAMGYDLHQDYPACWTGFPTSFTTVLIAIDPMRADNGCTEVFPGYHRNGLIDPEPGCFRLPAGAVDESHAVPLELQPGDAAVFGCYVPHRSAPNRSHRTRRALYVSYNARSDGGEQRARHYAEFREYLLKYKRSQGESGNECYFE